MLNLTKKSLLLNNYKFEKIIVIASFVVERNMIYIVLI